ncbi:serine/threonine-protein phosphatase 4 regulatory subunit 4-like [Daphnia carinata]|uniref:serine/threonine-protein phosphatase 4 regulatory subunit 4-like n=1 Tax=Daphnia carinata TaxID=120202 RepID=UPI00257C8649|nr:serine/threonine-protein phosphatase 4 regulatory subunit 4-like [Daphnia carinata]
MTHFTPFTQNFLDSILLSIDSKDPVVANAWLDTLLDVIDLLPIEVLGKEVLEIAVSKAGDSQPTFSRLGSCQLVGKLGMKLEQQVIQEELIPVTQNLSQDAEWTIRASMCAQLVSIIKGLTKNGENSEAKIPVRVVLSVLFELGDDEVEAVRLVVVETASAILQYLDEESVRTLVVPWLQRLCEHASKVEDKTLPLLAQHWARISRTILSHLREDEKGWFVEYFYSLASLGSAHQTIKDKTNMPDVVAQTDAGSKLEIYAEVRHACAVNSAAMVPFIGAEAFSQRISSIRALAADPYFVVRRAVAANILDLCRQLHPYSSVIHSLLNQLLIDPCPDVTFALVPQIGAVIENLARLPLTHQSPFVSEVVVLETFEAVLRCEEQVMNSSSWRMQADILSQLAAFPLCLPCHAVHDLLIPRLWHRIDTVRPLPCRVSAAQTLMLCVRSERRRQERSNLCSDILTRLASAKSCHHRMLFLRVCPILFDLLSRKFIRQHFFLPLIRLAGDKVANVRLRFAMLLPKLHISLRGLDVESEKRLIVELDSAVRWLVESEKDRDVKNELSSFFRWIEEQEAQNQTAEVAKRLQEEEEADKRKEAEEESVNCDPVVTDTSNTSTKSTVSSGRPNFFSKDEPDSTTPIQSTPQATPPDERPVALDPSTDDFYRDAGVRLTAPGTNNNVESIKNATSKNATTHDPSRIPSVQSRLRPPLKTTTMLPHFGIARGVQQVQPQPSIAYGVTVAPPMRRDVHRRPSASTQSLNAVKSRSQENLNVPPKPRAARPMSTCLGSNDLLSTSKHHSPFIRNRHRASIGGTASIASHKNVALPIATLPPSRSSESGPFKWGVSRPSSSTKTTTSTTGSVKLSDMKNALPVTPGPSRKQSNEFQLSRSKKPIETAGSNKPAERLEDAAIEMMESLELSSTRLRKPQTAIGRLITTQSSGSSGTTTHPAEASPMPRRPAWRRSLHFTTATSSPPPPPPRKNFATLPKSSANNNNNNNNNNLHHNPSSKLPVPAFKRNSHLGSNF